MSARTQTLAVGALIGLLVGLGLALPTNAPGPVLALYGLVGGVVVALAIDLVRRRGGQRRRRSSPS